jgi:uncharacterized protein YjiK
MHVFANELPTINSIAYRVSAGLFFVLISLGLPACEFRPANAVKLLAIQDATTPPASLQPEAPDSGESGVLQAVAGERIPTITVHAVRSDGSEQTSSEHKITARLESESGETEITGTLTQNFKDGAASFDDLIITRAGVGYRIVFKAEGGAQTEPVLVDVTPSAPASIHFDGALSGLESGTAIAGQALGATLILKDKFSNRIQDAPVDITLSLNTGTLFGQTVLSTANGEGVVSSLEVRVAGSNYQLIASSPGLTSATSEKFNISHGPAAVLQISSDVNTTVPAGTSIGNLVLISKDLYGNTATGHSSPITVSLQTNPSSATLAGTVTVTPAAGITTFSDLWVNKTGTGYTLGFSSEGLNATSAGFAITPAAISSASAVSLSSSSVNPFEYVTATLVAKDLYGNIRMGGGDLVTLTATSAAGGSLAVVGPTADLGSGSYTASILARYAGNSAAVIGANVGASATAVSNSANLTVLGSDGTFEYGTEFSRLNDSSTTTQQGTILNSGEIGDLNNDGIPDLVAVGGQQRIYLGGPGNRRYGKYSTFGTTNSAKGVALGDINQDGNLDVVVGYEASSNPITYLGNGSGALTVGQSLPFCDAGVTNTTQKLKLTDFDGDGRLDLILANEMKKNCLYRGLGSTGNASTQFTSFNGGSTQTDYSLDSFQEDTQNLTVADFNLDGKPDILMANRGVSQPKRLYINNGVNGGGVFLGFTMTTAIFDGLANTLPTQSLAVGDLNKDGLLDLVLGIRNNGGTLSPNLFAFGTGTGTTFGSLQSITGSVNTTDSYDLSLADLNLDGDLDLIESNRNAQVTMRKWNSSASNFTTFSATDSYGPSALRPYRSIPTDLNSDGRTDFIVLQAYANQSSFLLYGSRTGTINPLLPLTASGAANSGAKYAASPSLQTSLVNGSGLAMSNSSGITYVPLTDTYFVIRNTNNAIHEFSSGFTHLREITLDWNASSTPIEADLEDIVYLGSSGENPEFALVNERGELFIGTIPTSATSITKANFRRITFDNTAAATGIAGVSNNVGIEGIAYDSLRQVFYAVREGNKSGTALQNIERYIYRFPRPSGSADVNISALATTERWPFTTPSDLSSVTFDSRTERLLILSEIDRTLFEVTPGGMVWGKMTLTAGNQWEGVTIGPSGQIMLLSEPVAGNSNTSALHIYNYTP